MGRALLYDKAGYEVVPRDGCLIHCFLDCRQLGDVRQSDSPRIIRTDSEHIADSEPTDALSLVCIFRDLNQCYSVGGCPYSIVV